MVSLSRPATNAPLAERLQGTARPVLIHLPARSGEDSGVDARFEVSGSVLMTWAAKTASLCAAEDLGEGARVRLDLPVHWMSLAVAFGAVCAGAEPVFSPSPEDGGSDHSTDVDAVVTEDVDAPVPAGALGLRLALPRDLSPVRAHPDAVDPADVDLAEALLGEADRFAAPPQIPAATAVAPTGPAEDIHESAGAVVLQTGPLQARHLAAALHAWEQGRTVVVAAGDPVEAAREAGFTA